MRKFIFILCYFPLLVLANSTIYPADKVSEKPFFKGGENAFYNFINMYTSYDACYATPEGEYPSITASYIIDSVGRVHNVKCLNSLGSIYEGLVIDALQHMPAWNPGKMNGKNINVLFTIQVKYTIPGTDIYRRVHKNQKLKKAENNSFKKQDTNYIFEKSFPKFQNKNYSQSNLFVMIMGFLGLLGSLSLAVLPGVIIIMLIFYWRRQRPEPFKEIAKYFVFGILSIIPAIIIENIFKYERFSGLRELAFYAFVVVGFTEESGKFFFLSSFAFNKKNFTEPYDGILYSVIISMGFATAENIIYSYNGGSPIALIRMFTAVPAHAAFAILMGFFVGVAKFKKVSVLWMSIGLVIAIFFHGIYDFFLIQDDYPNLKMLTIFFLLVSIYLSVWAIKIGRRYKMKTNPAIEIYKEEDYTRDGL